MEKREMIFLGALVVSLLLVGYFGLQVGSLKSQVTSANSQVTDLQSQLSKEKLNINSKADLFDAKFHDLLQEHTTLLINTARRSVDSQVSFNDSLNALQRNVNDVSDQIAGLYGADIGNQFKTLWNRKVGIVLNYTNAIKTNDPTANSVFAAAAAQYEEDKATFWSNTNNALPNLDKAAMKQLITTHLNDVKTAIDYWNVKDFPNYFNALHAAYIQMGSYADILVQGMIDQNPDKFK